MSPIVKIALGVFVALCVAYLCGLAWLSLNQRRFLYPAPAADILSTPAPGASAIAITTADDLVLRAIYRPARGGRPTIIFFHGNGDSLRGSQEATQRFTDEGYGLLLPEYRGYGGNPGSQSEAGLYRDGRAALQWLASRNIPPARTILIGNSLGSGVASQMAVEHRVGALVLVSGFTSMADVVRAHFPFVPAAWLLRDTYENRRKMARIDCPILILHGATDTLIPARQGMLLAKAGRHTTLKIVPGRGHELAYTRASQDLTATWLDHAVPKE